MASDVLVTRLSRRSDLGPIVRAALDMDIAYVPLEAAPPPGRQTLQVNLGDEQIVTVIAELVGSGREGAFPMRLRAASDEEHEELERLAERRSLQPGERTSMSPGPRPSRHAAPTDTIPASEDVTLESRAVSPEPLDALPFLDASLAPADDRGGEVDEHPAADEAPTPPPIVPNAPMFDPGELLAESESSGAEDDAVTISRAPSGSAPLRSSVRPPLQPNRAPRASVRKDTGDELCGRRVGDGKYVLNTQIGSGALGLVFKASHRDLGRTVAIKVLNPRYRDDPDLLRVFKTEARAASLLEHPNIARVYDYGQEEDGLVYIVMEYLSGYTLGSVLDSRRRVAIPRAIDLMMQTCAGLSAAHERGIVHRDIKPDNIVLVPAQDDEGRPSEIVKVCDFGIAALGTAAAAEGAAAGTPEYMAPEQQLATSVTAAADIYACGIVLYEMITGQVPFTDPQPYRILIKQKSDPPRPPSEIDPSIPAALEAVILRCLEKDPANRYQTARALRGDLRKTT